MAINIPPLLASDGELAVIYRTASFLWGKWTVAYPEGVEPKDFEYGRALGYVGRLERPLAGRGSLRWMRTDVSINADAKFSEVPSAFAAAEKRTAGDVLFDAVIGEEGYGNLVPGVDLKVGDEVPVLLGGSKMLDLPVREIKPVVDGARLRFEVSVGGELTDQPAALDEYNNSIFATITEEQVKLQKELAAQRKQAELDKQQWRAIGDTTSQVKAVANRSWSLGQDLAVSNNMIANWSKAWRLLWTELEAVENVSMALREVMFEVVRALNAVDSGKAQAAVKAFNDRSSNHLASKYISYKQQLWWNQMNGRVVGEINTSKYTG